MNAGSAAAIVAVVDGNRDRRVDRIAVLERAGWCCRSFFCGSEALQGELSSLGCIALTAELPDMSSREFIARLAEVDAGLVPLVLCGPDQARLLVEALRAGAADALCEPCDEVELAQSVASAVQWTMERRRRLAIKADLESKLSRLSSAEEVILQRILEGKTTKSIAQLLHRSPKTVEYHRTQIMRKLRIDSLAELVRLAVVARHLGEDGDLQTPGKEDRRTRAASLSPRRPLGAAFHDQSTRVDSPSRMRRL